MGTTVFTLFGFSLQDSLFEFSSALANAGISIGINHYNAHPGILWTSIIGMIFGIIIGVIGLIGCGINYPIYKKMLEKGKAKYAYEIVQLAKEISED